LNEKGAESAGHARHVRVLGVLGSPRIGGNTHQLLREFLRGAAGAGATVEEVLLTIMNVGPCTGCGACDAAGECVIIDHMTALYPKLAEADLVVLSSPIYFYGVTAWMKAFIDRGQAPWAAKYRLKRPAPQGRRRIGFLMSVGATNGGNLFDGAVLTARYFFDAVGVEPAGELAFRGIDRVGDITRHPSALPEALDAGRRMVGLLSDPAADTRGAS
jgi:multimeric flavodoxin WrbA